MEPLQVDFTAPPVIQARKLEPRIMRYELSDFEWAAIKPFVPNKSRGVPRVNDRRVLNGIFWVLHSGAPWRDLPENFGPHTTCYNRFIRWRKAGVWDRIMNGLSVAHDARVQMIDTSIVRVHQHGACIAGNKEQTDGPVARWTDDQDPCGCRYQGVACPSRADHWRGARQPSCPHPAFRPEIGSNVAR